MLLRDFVLPVEDIQILCFDGNNATTEGQRGADGTCETFKLVVDKGSNHVSG